MALSVDAAGGKRIKIYAAAVRSENGPYGTAEAVDGAFLVYCGKGRLN